MSNFSLKEIERYQRHLSLPQFGEAAQQKLKDARVLVVGAGGLGCPVLQYLAAAGVGKLGVMDFDVVDASNLQRQILFTEADVGRPKAEVACERLRAMNSLIEVAAIPQRLTAANALDVFAQFDVIVDGSDNFTTRYLVNDACVLAKKPLIYGAIYTFQGQVSVFNYKGGPTYRCLFPDPPDPKDAPNCSEIGVIGVLPGLIGTLQASEAIKVITGIGEPLSGSLLLLDVLTMKQQTIKFNRVPEAADVKELVEIDFSCAVEETTPLSEEIDVDAFRKLLRNGSALQVLDVREDWERAISKMESFHIPLGQLLKDPQSIEASGLDLALPTVVYCKSGKRSMNALRRLREHHGFQDIHSLKGGMIEWERTVPSDSTPA
ncbi:MAG: HesA/MoeB/ThiF family protein [Verrucomicrobia bacterium]|nr:HesA/MoeB/ThiF family protein [Verrucomicrobiota bacterium]MDA1067395.1 HesA/MoeB/ThiF family protein [Verrucomicrobiota bacterium]